MCIYNLRVLESVLTENNSFSFDCHLPLTCHWHKYFTHNTDSYLVCLSKFFYLLWLHSWLHCQQAVFSGWLKTCLMKLFYFYFFMIKLIWNQLFFWCPLAVKGNIVINKSSMKEFMNYVDVCTHQRFAFIKGSRETESWESFERGSEKV